MPIEKKLFSNQEDIAVRALFIGKRLNLKKFEHAKRLTAMPYVIQVGANGYAVLFRYGVVVLFNLNAIEENNFLEGMSDFIVEGFEIPAIEEGLVRIEKKGTEGAQPEHIILKEWDLPRMQLVAEVLAKSAVLTHYEEQVKDAFDQMDKVSSAMKSGGWPKSGHSRQLLKHIGMTLSIQRDMVGQIEIEEKPDLLWDMPELTSIYMKTEAEYEITERHQALRNKLALIHQIAETMMGLLQERRTYHVEWYIVILIVIEVILGLYDKFM